VLDRLRALAVHPALQRIADGLLAAGILVGALADIAAHKKGGGWGGPLPLQLLAAAAVSVPLLWRRSHPIPVLALVFAGAVTNSVLVAPRQAGFEPFLALVVAYYSLGAHEEERRSLVVLVGSLALGVAPAAVVHRAPGDAAPLLVWMAAAWIIGRIIRSWRSRALALERANRLLEEQRELQAQAAIAVERARIARELHDVIAHNVSVMVVQAGAASRVLEGAQADVRAALDAIESTGRATVDEMRRLLGILRRADDGLALAPQPGLGDLGRLVETVREAGLPVELRVEGDPRVLPPALDLTAYRIAQEALTNALKHAGPTETDVTIRYEPDAVEIDVWNGISVARPMPGTGHGLLGMRERAALFGGKLDVGPADAGWRVRAWLPVAAG
jgi:signal transduction histidine kinase